ncbi:hypothetical protein TPY_2750 [Sulfobacillus acidophilus TPY]|nr:hypothetical protein TPY_2750 [Sulfobacillus acidophilus TPY]
MALIPVPVISQSAIRAWGYLFILSQGSVMAVWASWHIIQALQGQTSREWIGVVWFGMFAGFALAGWPSIPHDGSYWSHLPWASLAFWVSGLTEFLGAWAFWLAIWFGAAWGWQELIQGF